MPFSEILGQDKAVALLKKIVKTKKIASSYLFSGPEAVGKRKAAISFGLAINCDKNDGDFCGVCFSCKAFSTGNYSELILLEPIGPAGRHHIDTIRAMQESVSLRSIYGKWKVVIMDEAEKMTEEAASALLKIMEEPPPMTFFILVVSFPENIFRTILSRCHRIRFMPLSMETKRRVLKTSSLQDGIIATSRSGLKDAIQNLAPEKQSFRKDILSWYKSSVDIFSFVQKISKEGDGKDNRELILDALHLLFIWFRDSLFVKYGLGELLHRDFEKDIRVMALEMPGETIWNNINAILRAQRDIMHQVNSRLVLDTLFLELSKCTK
jgi:DNA polymerase-3 subunit delta'